MSKISKLYNKSCILFLIVSVNSSALVPVESLVLGDYEERYSQEKSDPLNYIFSSPRGSGSADHKKQLALYRGMIIEGENLDNFCKKAQSVDYPTVWDRTQVKRSLYSTLQYIGLDITVRALAQYAKAFEFSSNEYQNYIDNMVGNHCSSNLSVISKKQLKKAMMMRFSGENNFKLPTIEGNELFSSKLGNISTSDQYLRNEFATTTKLFKSFCSWGSEADNLRMMVPLIRNPTIYSLIVRQLTNFEIQWESKSNKLSLSSNNKTVQVYCENLVCRKTDPVNFSLKFPRSVGHQSLKSDFDRLYCAEVRDVIYDYNIKDKRILRELKERTLDEDNILVSQFIALLSGIPDFNLRAEKFDEGKSFMRASLDKTWSAWAKNQTENLKKDLYYEEPLTIELTDRKYFFKNNNKKLKVGFDVNLGEFDRTNQIVGKIKSVFEIKVSNKFIYWIQKQLLNIDPRINNIKQKLEDRLNIIVKPFVEVVRKKIRIPPWRGELSRVISKELIEQITLKLDNTYHLGESGHQVIPIEFYYGPFALKYIRYQYEVKKNEWRTKKREKDFRRKEIAKK